MKKIAVFFISMLIFVALLYSEEAATSSGLNGDWTLIPEKSSEIGLYRTLYINIQYHSDFLTIIQRWGRKRSYTDTLKIKTNWEFIKRVIRNRVFPTNVFMGLSRPVDEKEQVRAKWEEQGRILKIEFRYPLRGSQGRTLVKSIHTYQLSDNGQLLIYQIKRSTRETGPSIRYVLKRAGTNEAYFMKLEDHWQVQGKLDENAFLISLQGLANQQSPQLYFIYPENWPFTYTASVFEYYKEKRNFTFHQLKTPEEVLKTFIKNLKGFVVWDKNVRTSLIVAFTVAGLEDAVVVSERLIPLVEKYGLKLIEDFRGKFEGWNNAQIYKWAYDKYWPRCSRDFIVWLGGEAGPVMKPGIADWGINQRAWFNDLSSLPKNKEEYELGNKVLSQMNPGAIVMGWHSYAKDKERDHVKLISSHGLTIEGLHTLPDMSFNHHIPFSKNFKIKNSHHIQPNNQYLPKKKVYIACVQTDGLGLGAWLKPGRGKIPYAWEVPMNYVWMAPGLLEYFYTMATPNDYFIGCLSGPGYMYPKAVPPEKLPGLIKRAYQLMKKLDLRVFEIMDYSEGATVEGNTELTKQVVDAYYLGMPEAIGFLNGYAPAFTFTCRHGRPLISYDYYLSPTRQEEAAVADLVELASINNKRPYFLLIHVRESSDIERVKRILDKLPDEFEIVPLDIFIKIAGSEPTFKERFLKK